MRYKKRTKRKKTMRDKCWDAFSKYIRLRDANEYGRIQCCTCPHVGHWKQMHAGHFMSRANESTFLHEQNVNGQCRKCNGPESGRQYEHGLYIDKKHGQGTSAYLYMLSKKTRSRSDLEYDELRKYYKKAYEGIAKEKGLPI